MTGLMYWLCGSALTDLREVIGVALALYRRHQICTGLDAVPFK